MKRSSREKQYESEGLDSVDQGLNDAEDSLPSESSGNLPTESFIPLESVDFATEGRGAPDWASGSFEQWSRELGKRPLLSSEEEMELAKRMERGDQEARDRFIESNLKLVVSIAKRYRGCGVPMEDLIQEGNLGLIRAVDRFDPGKGCRFSTCAVTWIEGQIRRSIANLRHNIHLPLRVVAELRKVNRACDRLSHELGRQPSVEEIGKAMGLPVEHVKDLLSLPSDSVSLDEAVDADMERFLSEVVEDESAIFPDDALVVEHLRRQIAEALDQLPSRYRTVVKLRFGLAGEREHTLEEIGQKLNLTRQRVWQIESSALKKIKCLDCPNVHRLLA